MYNSIEYNDNYNKTWECLLKYCRDEPALNCDDAIVDFVDNISSLRVRLNLRKNNWWGK